MSLKTVYSIVIITTYCLINILPASSEEIYSSADCKTCHKNETLEWQKSDHANSMSIPTESSVIGRFGSEKVPYETKHKNIKAEFWKKQNKENPTETDFFMRLKRNNTSEEFKLSYTFGWDPLQQYLIEQDKGKFQVFPFAWDNRAEEKGGQRWFTQYPSEDIKPEDRLHWQQPLQNWNGMCADCHSDGLKRNYHTSTDRFSTTFASINVDCLACHDDKKLKHSLDTPKSLSMQKTSKQTPIKEQKGRWTKREGHPTLEWQGLKRDNQFMDACFACHSLRTPLSDGFNSTSPYLDQFQPTLLNTPNYYPDGQIKEEVFVYGSFLQSKMYEKGVNCIDCHQAHSLELKLPGNALCLQCHSSAYFNTKTHHGHQDSSSGAQCINCHMPETTFMGVDKRADHRFGIPRPDWSQSFDVPNACSHCHQDKSFNQLSSSIESWLGRTISRDDESAYIRLMVNSNPSASDIIDVVQRKSLPDIKRATALSLLAQSNTQSPVSHLSAFLSSDKPLMRLAAVIAAQNLPSTQRLDFLLPMLDDQYKSIRLEASNHLIGLEIPTEYQEKFTKLLATLITINSMNSWRAEGEFANALIATKQNDAPKAMSHYQQSIKKEPFYSASYINLAEIFRLYGKIEAEKSTLMSAIKNTPNEPLPFYALGLFQVRQKDYAASENSLRQAYTLNPSNSQFIYAFALVLEKNNNLQEAINVLNKGLSRLPDDRALASLLQQFLRK